MNSVFTNQEYGAYVSRHNSLPIFRANAFNFFRIIPFSDDLYERTAIELHSGNLRMNKSSNRYSNIFPGKRVSYWSDSLKTAKAEFFHWHSTKNILSFWAYDDGSSSIPTIYPPCPLTIIDGRDKGINKIIKKRNENIELDKNECFLLDDLAYENPDCLAYESEQRRGGINYLFFEQGFKKLSLRQVHLRLGDKPGKNTNTIICADGSDYTPCLKGYLGMFMPKARIKYKDLPLDSKAGEDIFMKLQVEMDWEKRLHFYRK